MGNEQILSENKATKEETKQGNYVQIPMKMFAFGSDFFVTNDELLVYYMLGTMVSARSNQHVECDINQIRSKLVLDKSNTSRGKARIQEALQGLHNKKYILLSYDDKDLKYSTLLEIFILRIDTDQEVKSGKWTFKGYVKVYNDMFDDCDGDPRYFKVIIYTEWRMFRGQKDEGKYKVSLNEWRQVLGVSRPTAIKILKQCVEDKLISKELGKKYIDENGKCRQPTNGYSPISKEERVVMVKKEPTFTKQVNTIVKSSIEGMKVTDARVEKTNLFKTDRLTGYCIYVWKTTNCEVTKAQGTKRIDKMKASGTKGYTAYKIIEEKSREIEREEKAKIQSAKYATETRNVVSYHPDLFDDDDEDHDDYKKSFANTKKKREEREVEQQQKQKTDAIEDEEDDVFSWG